MTLFTPTGTSHPHTEGEIPVRFVRAAARARLARRLLRLSLALLILIAVVASLYWFVLPRYLEHQARRRLAALGCTARLRVTWVSWRQVTIRDLSIVSPLATISAAEVQAGFRLGELKRRELRWLVVRGLCLDLTPEIMSLAQPPSHESAAPAAPPSPSGPLPILHDVTITDAILRLAGDPLPRLDVPLAIHALHDPQVGYRLAITAILRQTPMRLEGTIDPQSGDGQLAASGQALAVSDWLGLLHPSHGQSWSVTQSTGTADLTLALALKAWSPTWFHAELDAHSPGATLAMAQPASASTPQTFALVADRLAVVCDAIPGPAGALATTADLTLTAPRLRGAATPIGEVTVTGETLTGQFHRQPGPDGRLLAGGTVRASGLEGTVAGTTATCVQADVTIPDFLSVDTFRWQSSLRQVAIAIPQPNGTAAATVESVSLRGTLASLDADAPLLTLAWPEVGEATATIKVQMDATGPQPTVSATVSLTHATLKGLSLLPCEASLTFTDQRLTARTPQLAVTQWAGLKAVDGAAELDLSLPKPRLVATGKAVCDDTALATLPVSGLHLAEPATAEWRFEGTLAGTVPEGTATFRIAIPTLTYEAAPDIAARTRAELTGTLTLKESPILEAMLRTECTDVRVGTTQMHCPEAVLTIERAKLRDVQRSRQRPPANSREWLEAMDIAGEILASGIAITQQDSHANGGVLELPFDWRGEAGLQNHRKSDRTPLVGSLAWQEASLRGVPLRLGAFSIEGSEQSIAVSGHFGTPDQALTGTLTAMADVSVEPALLLRFDVAAPDLAKVPWNRQWLPSQFSSLAVSGGLALQGSVFRDPGGWSGGATLELRRVGLELPARKLALLGLDGRIEFNHLPRPATPPRQTLTFGQLSLGKTQFTKGAVTFQVSEAAELLVDEFAIQGLGGRISTQGLRVPGDGSGFDGTLVAEGLDLGQLMAVQTLATGTGSGKVYGRLSIAVKNGLATYGEGFLYSEPGMKGWLKISDPTAFTDFMPKNDSRTRQTQEALRDLELTLLRIDVLAREEPSKITLRIEGSSRSSPGLPPLNLSVTFLQDSRDVQSLLKTFSWLEQRAQQAAGSMTRP